MNETVKPACTCTPEGDLSRDRRPALHQEHCDVLRWWNRDQDGDLTKDPVEAVDGRRLTEQRLDELEREALQLERITLYQQITLPTMHVRQMLAEIRELRDAVCVLQMKVDGGKAIVEAIEAAVRVDVHTKLSEIQIQRKNGPSFYLVDALRNVDRSEP